MSSANLVINIAVIRLNLEKLYIDLSFVNPLDFGFQKSELSNQGRLLQFHLLGTERSILILVVCDEL